MFKAWFAFGLCFVDFSLPDIESTPISPPAMGKHVCLRSRPEGPESGEVII